MWLRLFFDSIGLNQSESTTIFEDNQSTIAFAKSEKTHARMKHLNIKLHYVQEAIKNNVINVVYCPTTDMLADIFTKGLSKQSHENLCKNLVVNIH